MKLFVVIALLASAYCAHALPVENEVRVVEDSNGNLHLVNPDPYTVVDAELEPRFVPENDIRFLLFTRSNPVHGQVLEWNNPSSILSSNFNVNDPTRFIIHGWNGDHTSGLNANIRQNFFARGEFNMITVDWGVGAGTINYLTARNRVASVGEIVARMVDTLVATTGVSYNSINLIGHSLGAHAAGNAGRMVASPLNTIIGLDAAGVSFSLSDNDILSPNDAQYVEVMYTAAGSLGFDLPLGHSNFFPNGGRSQPGCGIDLSGSCAHSRAHQLYAESISTTIGFRSTRCASLDEINGGACTPSGPDALMGGEPSNRGLGVEGVFRLTTNANEPRAQG
ncbi:inactive pancreatic lipase-related protein 1-like [Uranotaenia lowii]|uniref:inactive pancreatic lipase-related protein 1-like n=1 Tax=Uranotaenia lowii TaxID=190385 RepID=UPI00247AB684|nr:inactive pancreatic lipase-related protein 1-like [Uranotaenia lowii]